MPHTANCCPLPACFLSLPRPLPRQLDELDQNAAVNFEYLKNCVFRFMVTKDQSEQQRVSPVIATILQFTTEERQEVEQAMKASSSALPVPFRLGRWT